MSSRKPTLRRQLRWRASLASCRWLRGTRMQKPQRHPKKSVCQKTIAEVQGAIVDGFLGVAYPKPMKVGLYVCLALELLRRACYATGNAGSVWRFCLLLPVPAPPFVCLRFNLEPPVVRLPLPGPVQLELARFCALIPLVRICQPDVTAIATRPRAGGPVLALG